VKPRSKIRLASSFARPNNISGFESGFERSASLLALRKIWTWLSIRPGIKVRPPPSITVTPSGAFILPGCIEAIIPSLTRTLIPFRTTSDLPVKTLTFVNIVGAVASAVCASAPVTKPELAAAPTPAKKPRRESVALTRFKIA
jgi:hypothetical protein